MVAVDSVLLSGLVLLPLGLGGVLMVILLHYQKLVGKFLKLQREDKHLREETQKEAEKLLEKAQKEALETVEEAHRRARKVVRESEIAVTKMEELLRRELEKVLTVQTKNYYQMLEKIEREVAQGFEKAGEKTQVGILEEIEDFRKVMEQQTIKSQEAASEKIDGEFAQVREEIKAYRAKMLGKVDQSIFEILQEVSQEVLGKALSVKEHEELVIKALYEAKRRKIF